MADYRRYRVEGGTYFFTRDRKPLFVSTIAQSLLGNILRECQSRWPFELTAVVLLPEHLHAIWTLPRNDAGYSQRWAWIKKEFTKAWRKAGGAEQSVSEKRVQRGDAGIWQPRFWEHTIRDEHDFDRHFDYVHYNPVKHGHVRCPKDWQQSSFHRWVERRVYEPSWGCADLGMLEFDDISDTAIEP